MNVIARIVTGLIISLFSFPICLQAGLSFTPTVDISAAQASAYESPAAPAGQSRNAIFVVSRRCCTAKSLTVAYTINGTAANGIDYLRLSGSVTIPAGRQTARVMVKPIDDGFIDPQETVVLTLRPGSGYTLRGRTKAKAVIADSGSRGGGDGFISPGGSFPPPSPLP